MKFVGLVNDEGTRMVFDYPSQYRAFIKTLAGHEVEVELRKKRSKRSLRQNAWFHAFMEPFAASIGETVPDLKLIGLVAVFGTKVVMGYTVPVYAHTSELDTHQFSDLCEWFVQKAAECGFVVLYPDEFKRKKRARRGAGNNPGEVSKSPAPGLVGASDGVQPSAASRDR